MGLRAWELDRAIYERKAAQLTFPNPRGVGPHRTAWFVLRNALHSYECILCRSAIAKGDSYWCYQGARTAICTECEPS